MHTPHRGLDISSVKLAELDICGWSVNGLIAGD